MIIVDDSISQFFPGLIGNLILQALGAIIFFAPMFIIFWLCIKIGGSDR